MTAPIPDDDAWLPWTPEELAHHLAGTRRAWYVVGGWALDLWHGRQTRPHEDLEFAVLRGDLGEFAQCLSMLRFHAAQDGVLTPCPLPGQAVDDVFQFWGLDRQASAWRVDMMVEPGTPQTWVFKRQADMARPRADMVWRSAAGIPHLNPAAVLLFKAKHVRTKDEADLDLALPSLPEAERRWLHRCLSQLHPGHAWPHRL
jgi:hypothetical protein